MKWNDPERLWNAMERSEEKWNDPERLWNAMERSEEKWNKKFPKTQKIPKRAISGISVSAGGYSRSVRF